MPRSEARRSEAPRWLLVLLSTALGALFLISFAVGRLSIPLGDVLRILASRAWATTPTWSPTTESIVNAVRLPRILAAVLVGGGLAVGGAAYQTLFRNPLVSPSLLGVSAGSAVGAATALLLMAPRLVVLGASFCGGLVAVSCTLLITSRLRTTSLSMLVLAGIVTSTFFEALVSFVKYVADPIDALPAITFWLLGGLGKVSNRDVAFAAPPMLVALVVLWLLRWPLTVVSLGDDDARALGIHPRRVRAAVIVATTLLTAPAVSLAGLIGWVGLLVPHMARMLVGARFQYQLPIAFLLGAGVLLAVDDLVRVMPVEAPLGAAMAIVGAPAFVALLIWHKTTWT